VAARRIYLDAAYDVKDVTHLRKSLGRKFESLILSTSSDLFLDSFDGNINHLFESITKGEIAKTLLFKENRGGSRLFSEDGSVKSVGAQLRPIVHSVGVGDVYNVVFAALRSNSFSDEEALAYASFIAAEYASTTYPDDFKTAVQNSLKIARQDAVRLKGVILPWEKRKQTQVYIAAPDFDYMNRQPIEDVFKALKYHNFSPRRPVKENGQIKPEDSASRRFDVFNQDMKLLNECHILVAVLIDNDPGTFIEIGLSSEKGLQLLFTIRLK
jgi:hypothetical protein